MATIAPAARTGRRCGLAAAALSLAIGVVAIILSWTRLSATIDEGNHLAAGLEWLQQGSYGMWTENPPLPRVAVALIPFLAGARLPPPEAYTPTATTAVPTFISWNLGNQVLYRDGRTLRNLAQARAGTLPFFILAVVLTGLLAAWAGGWPAGVIATIAVASLPPLLGNASVATTDVAFVATFLLSLWTFLRWLGRPTPARAIALGGAVAMAVLSKFTALAFFPVAAAALVVGALARPGPALAPAQRLSGLALALAIAALGIWAGYRFSFGRVDTASFPRAGMGGPILHPAGERHGFEALFTRVPLPAPAFFHGLLHLKSHNDSGHRAFMLGEYRQHGFRLFYPVALFFKAPLPFLLLLAAGLPALLWRRRDPAARRGLALAAAGLGVLLVLIPSHVNLGVRHALAVYALAGAAAAVGLARLLSALERTRQLAAGAAIAALLIAEQANLLTSHPDHIASFNMLAGSDPGRVLEGADLDWGQGLYQLARETRARGVTELQVALWAGFLPACQNGLPRLVALQPHQPVTGWVAVSQAMYSGRMESFHLRDACDPWSFRGNDRRLAPGWFWWLHAHQPVWLGSGIRLYHISP